MRYSQSVFKTVKNAKQYGSRNATLLQKAGYIDQLMSGVYTLLPLGFRVISKIEAIVREEMCKIGEELKMPSLAPIDLWEKTERYDSVDVLFKASAANDSSHQRNSSDYVLSPTHEEVITSLAKKYTGSYRDFPFALFQIQTKFRNEERAKSGHLRLREFAMKDLYSFHTSKEDLERYYKDKAIPAYERVFERLGIDDITVRTTAFGGDFTENNSDEFQTLCDAGEDLLYYFPNEDVYYNRELEQELDLNHNEYKSFNASEVGNIFQLDQKYSEKFDFTFVNRKGKRDFVYMGCYGIGISRILGVLAEVFNDRQGLRWPVEVAPYQVHLLSLNGEEVYKEAEEVYNQLNKNGIEVLWDDREDISAGEKFADADLIGLPYLIRIGRKGLEKGEYDIKCRTDDRYESISKGELDKYLTNLN